MLIIGCDFHPGFQQIAMCDTSSNEVRRRRLEHVAEARQFYAQLQGEVRVGVEACGSTQWFEQMLAQMGHELWLGDAARIRRSTFLREIRHDLRFADEANRLERQELGVAGAEPDAVKPAKARCGNGSGFAHSVSLASALMAATASALPPRLPRTTR